MSIQRSLAVSFPHRIAIMCTKRAIHVIIGLLLFFNAVFYIPELLAWKLVQYVPGSPWLCGNVIKPSDGVLYDYFNAYHKSFVHVTTSFPQLLMIISICVMLYHIRYFIYHYPLPPFVVSTKAIRPSIFKAMP